MSDRLHESLQAWLARRRDAHELHQRRITESPQQPVMRIGGRRLLAFCSDDYLGFANHPKLVDTTLKAVRQWGVGAAATPLSSGYSKAHQALEEAFAAFTSRPRALTFATPAAASSAVLDVVTSSHDTVLQDSGNRGCLLQAAARGGRRDRCYAHADPDSLASELSRLDPGRAIVASEGVFSVDGAVAPLAEVASVGAARGAWLAVDDSHGIGVLGNSGGGACELHGVQPDALICSLGNALGAAGAVVAGSEALIENLAQRAPDYGQATALPPAIAEAARAALQLLETEAWRRETVWALTERFKTGARRLGLPLAESPTPIQPLRLGDSASAFRFSEALAKAGILVPPVLPPAVAPGQALLRITLSAAHTVGHIDSLLSALDDAWRTLDPGSGGGDCD